MRDIFAEFEKMENEEIAEKMKNATPAPANAKYSPEPEPDNAPAPADEPEPDNNTPADEPANNEQEV